MPAKSKLAPEEDTKLKPLSIRSAVPRRFSANHVDVEENQITRPRGNVCNRLGKPCEDNESTLRGEIHQYGPRIIKRQKLNRHVEELQDLKSMLVDPYAQIIDNETEKVAVLDKGHGRIISDNHLERYDILECSTQGSLEQLGKSKGMRHYSDINCGNRSVSHSGSEESCLQDKEAFQKTKVSLPVKCNSLPRLNELASNAKNTTEIFPEPSCPVKSLSNTEAQSDKVVQSLLKESTPPTTTMQNPVPFCSSASNKSKSIKYASGNSESKPMQNEMLDVKLKLHQVEKCMHKLHSKQADLSSSKPIPPSGLQNNSKEDVESRTVFVTNVIRKAEMPPGSLAPTQPAMKLPRPWHLQLYKKGPVQRHYSSSHLQWGRDESANRKAPSLPLQTV